MEQAHVRVVGVSRSLLAAATAALVVITSGAAALVVVTSVGTARRCTATRASTAALLLTLTR